jgi:prevent-host-death family protein
MSTVSIEEAQSNLPELIERLKAGDELVITRDSRPVARLIPPVTGPQERVFGSGSGKLVVVAEDDEHLGHFEDYMP